nr:developmentally-regulated GTP-binding protein 2-like [Cherax quadricarinatus]
MKLNLDYLLERMWQELSLLRIYTKKPGRAPDFSDPIILRGGATVEHVCHSIHRSIVAVFKYALVWLLVFVDSEESGKRCCGPTGLRWMGIDCQLRWMVFDCRLKWMVEALALKFMVLLENE